MQVGLPLNRIELVKHTNQKAAANSIRCLRVPIRHIVSRAGMRVNCDHCGEEIINEREVIVNGQSLCRACATGGYHYGEEELCLPLSLLYSQK